MAHAQRLLPIEQLLSDVAASSNAAGTSPGRTPVRPSIVSGGAFEARRTDTAPPARPTQVSPFAADSARKSGPRQESPADAAPGTGPRSVAGSRSDAPVVFVAASPSEWPPARPP